MAARYARKYFSEIALNIKKVDNEFSNFYSNSLKGRVSSINNKSKNISGESLSIKRKIRSLRRSSRLSNILHRVEFRPVLSSLSRF